MSRDTEPLPPGGPKTVLVVDDDDAIRLMVREFLLGKPGLHVLEAADGLEAVDMLLKHPVDLVILDLNMPRMNGLEVAAFLRTRPGNGAPIVVMFTTEKDAYTRRKAMAQGVHHYMNKPFNPLEFNRLLGRLLATGGEP